MLWSEGKRKQTKVLELDVKVVDVFQLFLSGEK